METLINVLGMLLSAFTTLAVAWMGSQQAKKTKETEAYRKLKDEKDQLIREKEEEERNKLNTRLDNMEGHLESLTGEVTTLNGSIDMKKIESQLSQLHVLNEVNFEYVQSLSGVVSAIGESLTSSSLVSDDDKKRVEKKIDDHKEKEGQITSNLYKITV